MYQGKFRIVPVRRGDGRHPTAGERRGNPYFLRRPGLLQRSHPWPEARTRLARSIPPTSPSDAIIKIQHLIDHAELLNELRAKRMPVHHLGRGSRGRRHPAPSRQEPHQPGLLLGRGAHARARHCAGADLCCLSRPGRHWKATSRCSSDSWNCNWWRAFLQCSSPSGCSFPKAPGF